MKPIRYILNAATLFTLTTAMGQTTPVETEAPFSLFAFEDEDYLNDDSLENPLASTEEENAVNAPELANTEETAVIVESAANQEELTASFEIETIIQEAATQDTVALANSEVQPVKTEFVSLPEESDLFDEASPIDNFFADEIEAPSLTPIEPIVLEKAIQATPEETFAVPAEVQTAIVESPVKEEVIATPTQERMAFEAQIQEDEITPSQESGKAIALSSHQLPKEFANEGARPLQINISQVFAGSPLIYSLLLIMSMGAVFIWLYNVLSLRYTELMPEKLLTPLRNRLNSNQYDEALLLCSENDNFFTKMVASGIRTRRNGAHVMIEAMKAEGKRATGSFWTRMALLNDIAIIAPMLGLLGTVLGMFYAFYDLNRTTESVTTLFDGLGISVGTTVAGLVVAILAMILHSTAKYRLVRMLARVENEAYSYANIIENKTPNQGA